MKAIGIRFQLMLVSLGLLLAMGLTLVISSSTSIADEITSLQRASYDQSLQTAIDRLAIAEQRLNERGASQADRSAAQQTALRELAERLPTNDPAWPRLLIIDQTGDVLLEPADATAASTRIITDELTTGPDGSVDIAIPDHDTIWCLKRTFTPWQWRLIHYLPHTQKYATVRQLRQRTITVATLCFLIAAVALYLLIHRSLRPITRLTAAANAMAAGDLTRIVRIENDDEVADLARSFIVLRQAVLDKIADLEQEVREKEVATAALSASEENLAITLDSIAEGVIAADPEGRIVRMNPVAEALTGWAEPAAIGQPIDAIYHLVDTHEDRNLPGIHQRIAGNQEATPLEACLIARDGTRRLIHDQPAHIRDPAGEIAGTVLVFRDVTEQHELEERMRHGERLDAIGQLAGGVAHDFNNMLAGIIGSSELLLDDLSADDPRSELAKDIISTGERAADLAAKLLAFSRRDHQLNLPFDMHRCIEDSISILQRSIDKRIHISIDLQPEQPVVLGDPAQMQNALINIGVNARDAMPDGGRLHFATELGSDDTAIRLGLPPGPCFVLTITDNGPGIDPEILPRVFEPFVTTKAVGQATGLGLSAVYGCIQAHRGNIAIDNNPDGGTRISIHLPLESAVCEEGPITERHQATPRGSGRILLVDDEAVVRAVARRMLESLGYTVEVACDGRAAVQIFHEDPDGYDAVVLDMVMPHMDGHETLLSLRGIRPDVPVLIASGYTRSHISTTENRLLDFIAKPYHRAELAQCLASLLTEHRERMHPA